MQVLRIYFIDVLYYTVQDVKPSLNINVKFIRVNKNNFIETKKYKYSQVSK